MDQENNKKQGHQNPHGVGNNNKQVQSSQQSGGITSERIESGLVIGRDLIYNVPSDNKDSFPLIPPPSNIQPLKDPLQGRLLSWLGGIVTLSGIGLVFLFGLYPAEFAWKSLEMWKFFGALFLCMIPWGGALSKRDNIREQANRERWWRQINYLLQEDPEVSSSSLAQSMGEEQRNGEAKRAMVTYKQAYPYEVELIKKPDNTEVLKKRT